MPSGSGKHKFIVHGLDHDFWRTNDDSNQLKWVANQHIAQLIQFGTHLFTHASTPHQPHTHAHVHVHAFLSSMLLFDDALYQTRKKELCIHTSIGRRSSVTADCRWEEMYHRHHQGTSSYRVILCETLTMQVAMNKKLYFHSTCHESLHVITVVAYDTIWPTGLYFCWKKSNQWASVDFSLSENDCQASCQGRVLPDE